MRKSLTTLAAAALLVMGGAMAAVGAESSYTVTDITGREIRFERTPQRALALGHSALQHYAYVCGADRLVGVEYAAKSGHSLTAQSAHYAWPSLRELPVVGKGGPKFSPDYEQIAYREPDVVFMAYGNTREELDELQKKLNVPVVGIDEGKTHAIFGEDAYRTFEIIGRTMQVEARAEAVIRFMKAAREDLERRVAGAPSNGASVYIGGCSFRGAQGILSTKSRLDLLSLVKANNVMTPLTSVVSVVIDKEKLIELDPEIILLDLSGKKLLDENMKKEPDFYRGLQAFRNHRAYALMPYFTYGMNYDTAILDTYVVGKIVHPDRFADVDFAQKAGEIYTFFVGHNVYPELKREYPESFGEVRIGE